MHARNSIAAVLVNSLACTRVPATAPEGEAVPPKNTPSVIVESAAAPRCTARTPSGAPLLIPDMAEWMVHVAPRALLQSNAWSLFGPKLENSSDWTQIDDALRPCGLSLAHVDHVLVGFDADEEFVAVAIAPSIGRHDVARCVITQIQQATNAPQDADIEPLPGDASVSIMEFTDGRAFLFGEDMLALVTTRWRDTVTELSSCRGTSAVRGSLAEPLRGLDHDAPLWVAARPRDQTLASLGASLGIDTSSMSTLGASVRLDNGASLMARMQMGDSVSATTTGTLLRSVVMMTTTALPPELAGVPNRILVDVDDQYVELRMTLLYDELRFIATLM